MNPIQAQIKARLEANSYFTGVDILTADDGDIENELDRRLATLKGLAVVIFIPVGENMEPRSNSVTQKLRVEVAAIERVMINRSEGGLDKRAYEASRQIVRPSVGLHFWEPEAPFSRLEYKFTEEGSTKTKGGKNLLIYNSVFETTETIS